MMSRWKPYSLFTLVTASLSLLSLLSCGLSETNGESVDTDEITISLRELYLQASDQIDQTVDRISVNLNTAAEKLGVAVDTLTEALRMAADLETAAEKLKVPIEKLREVLSPAD